MWSAVRHPDRWDAATWSTVRQPLRADRQARETLQAQTVPALSRTGRGQPGEPLEQGGQRDLRLEPGQGRAEAVVDAAAERQRRAVRPVQPQLVGALEAL